MHRLRCPCGREWDQSYPGPLPETWKETCQFMCECLGDPETLGVIITGRSSMRIRFGMRGTMQDYREDLAAFPGDPDAFIDGPAALKKLKDKRKAQGWLLRPIEEAASGQHGGDIDKPLAAEAFEEAKASGFRLEGEDK